jgi:hypothetical protein
MRPKPSFTIQLPKMDPLPAIEPSSPSAAPIRHRIASLEALRQEHLRSAAEIEKEVARLNELLIADPSPNAVEHTHKSPRHSLTFSANVEYHDSPTVEKHETDDPSKQMANNTLSVLLEPILPHSPLPKANLRHAGHTPLIPSTPSPKHRSPTAETTPEHYLDGPLTLPPAPGDGSDDGISLRALGERLADIAKERGEERLEGEVAVEGEVMEVVTERREIEADGILLKKPTLNFGVPLGQL